MAAAAADLPGMRAADCARWRGKSAADVAALARKDPASKRLPPAIAVAWARHRPHRRIPRAVGAAIRRRLAARCPARKFELVGSWRRGKEHPGDVDVLTTARLAGVPLAAAGDVLAEYASGPAKRSAILAVRVGKKTWRVPVDLFRAAARDWGTALLHFTGPYTFNIGARAHAKRAGRRLSQHGVTDLATGRVRHFASERAALAHVGKTWKAPAARA
jgi:DNA polymerase/3'-5' exonuclease PolX